MALPFAALASVAGFGRRVLSLPLESATGGVGIHHSTYIESLTYPRSY